MPYKDFYVSRIELYRKIDTKLTLRWSWKYKDNCICYSVPDYNGYIQ